MASALENPALGVGLHFNLTQGSPVAPKKSVQSLLNTEGEFLGRGELIKRYLLRQIRPEEVSVELEAQLLRMKRLGLQPTHLDSHQHIHALPSIFSVYSSVAAKNFLPIRMTRRWPGRPAGKPLIRKAKEIGLQRLTEECEKLLPRATITNDGLCSLFDLNVPLKDISALSYSTLLDVYREGFVELMVHPAEVDEDLRSKTSITEISSIEDGLLRSDFLLKYIEGRGGRLIRYDDASMKSSKCAA